VTRSVPWFIAGLALVLLWSASAPAAPEIPADAPQPLPVGVALSVLDIQGIRENLSTLFATVELRLTWHDSALAFDPLKLGADRLKLVDAEAKKFLDDHWNPQVGIVNLTSTTGAPLLGLQVQSDGTITVVRTIVGGFYARSDFSDFPFDRQAFAFDIASSKYNRDQLSLEFGPAERAESSIDPHVRQPQWKLDDLDAVRSDQRGWDGTSYEHLAIRLLAARNTGQYAPQIFLPYFFIMMAPIIVLVIRTDNLVQKATILSGASLAMLALQFSIATSFPEVVLTDNIISRMLYLGYGFLVTMVVLVITIFNTNLMLIRDPYLSEELRRQLHWVPAAAYLVILIGTILAPILRHSLA
jgi:hypothetical protein